MSDDKDKRVGFRVEEDTYKVAKSKLEHGEMSDRLRETIVEIAHGADTAEKGRVKANLEEWRDERNDIDAEIQKLKSDRRNLERKISRAEDRLNDLQEQTGEYDGTLAMLESDLWDGLRIFDGSKKVKEAASLGDCEAKDVVNDLQERNPEAPACAFRPGRDGEEPNWRREVDPLGEEYGDKDEI